jgi:trans-2,3-dihydro-3-hydroxyanthranilate isomerase
MSPSRGERNSLAVTLVHACLRDGGGGSPTAVVADQTWLGDDQRQRVPALAGASHAVFVETEVDEDTGKGIGPRAVSLRFFTAEGELPACGHGTVAALAYLAEDAGAPGYHAVLRTAGGRAVQGRVRCQRGLPSAEFEAGEVGLREPTEQELVLVSQALGLPAQPPASRACVATLGRPRMLLPVAGRSGLETLCPDLPALRDACLRFGLLGCYVYTVPLPGEGASAARMFAPAIGVPEDIANANSTACLAAHLHAIDAGSSGVTVDMGDSLGSPATVSARVVGRSTGTAPQVYVGGTARVERTLSLRP